MWSVGASVWVVAALAASCDGRAKRSEQSSPHIGITVSALASALSIRVLDIEWNVHNLWEPGDYVALYSDVPTNRKQNLLYQAPVESKEGWIRTDIQENRKAPQPNFNKTCMGFWAAYWKKLESEEHPLAVSCLTTNPTWMQDNWEAIKHMKLSNVFLPGTHDAGAYQTAFEPFEPNRFQKYVFAQDETILEQLIHGTRYLDFRIGRYQSGFWLNHDIARVHLLDYVLEDVKTFLNNTKEIVIIDIHNFPVGFKGRPESHTELVAFLKVHLGNHMVSFMGYETTLQQIRDSGKQLIVAYNDAAIAAKNPRYLWHAITQKWGNVRSVSELYNYLSPILNRPPRNTVWAAMAEMTPDAWGILTDKYKGLRNMADMTNHNVTHWFRGEWGYRANVVAVDFIRSTGLVDAAIKWNKDKGSLVRHKRITQRNYK